jgi:uncharacterized membrane protein
MTINILLTLLSVITIVTCTDTMRSAWESKSGAVFTLALVVLMMGTIGLVLRVISLTGQALLCS